MQSLGESDREENTFDIYIPVWMMESCVHIEPYMRLASGASPCLLLSQSHTTCYHLAHFLCDKYVFLGKYSTAWLRCRPVWRHFQVDVMARRPEAKKKGMKTETQRYIPDESNRDEQPSRACRCRDGSAVMSCFWYVFLRRAQSRMNLSALYSLVIPPCL